MRHRGARRRPKSGKGLSYSATTGKLQRQPTTPSAPSAPKPGFCATTIDKCHRRRMNKEHRDA